MVRSCTVKPLSKNPITRNKPSNQMPVSTNSYICFDNQQTLHFKLIPKSKHDTKNPNHCIHASKKIAFTAQKCLNNRTDQKRKFCTNL